MKARLLALLRKYWPALAAVAACCLAFLAGRYSRSPETRTVTKRETETVTLYVAHLTTTSTDKTKVRIVTVTKREPGGTVYVTKTEDRASDLRLDLNWTGTESNRASETAEAMTVTRSSSPGWSVGGSALWSTRQPSLRPETYQLEVDRRLFGTLWVGVRANTDRQAGAAIKLEW